MHIYMRGLWFRYFYLLCFILCNSDKFVSSWDIFDFSWFGRTLKKNHFSCKNMDKLCGLVFCDSPPEKRNNLLEEDGIPRMLNCCDVVILGLTLRVGNIKWEKWGMCPWILWKSVDHFEFQNWLMDKIQETTSCWKGEFLWVFLAKKINDWNPKTMGQNGLTNATC